MARDVPEEIGWSMTCDGLKSLDGVWHIMARRDWMEYMAHDDLKRLDGVWHMMV
jgi:hypothetical protein